MQLHPREVKSLPEGKGHGSGFGGAEATQPRQGAGVSGVEQ